MTLEDRVERLERELGIEDDGPDSTVYVTVVGASWDTDSLAIYEADEVAADGHSIANDYLVAADEYVGETDSLVDVWAVATQYNCDDAVVDETYGFWTSDIDDDVLDEYFVEVEDEQESDWRETFEDIFYHDEQEVIEVADNPAVIQYEDEPNNYVGIGQMSQVDEAGWKVHCVHPPSHDSAHDEIRETDNTVVRFIKDD